MEPKVGDVIKTKNVSKSLNLVDGTVGTIVEGDSGGPMTMVMYKCRFFDGPWLSERIVALFKDEFEIITIPKTEEKKDKPCSCESRSLFHYGCKCGAFKKVS